jgi:hypothetical protein
VESVPLEPVAAFVQAVRERKERGMKATLGGNMTYEEIDLRTVCKYLDCKVEELESRLQKIKDLKNTLINEIVEMENFMLRKR